MGLNFEWDERKARSNQEKHAVSFEEATTVFSDPLSLTIPDPDSSEQEPRFVLLGQSYSNRLVVVVHTERQNNVRIISARKATRSERIQYEQI